MNSTTKGSLAALAAATLLVGGAGSLAYWNDSTAVAGTEIASGTLDLSDPVCPAGWLLDGTTPYVGQLLVPGDFLVKTCVIDLTATGAHLGAELAITAASFDGESNGLTDQLVPTATYTVNGQPSTHITSADANEGDEPEIQAVVKVEFPRLADGQQNASKNLQAALEAVTITATQTHDTPEV